MERKRRKPLNIYQLTLGALYVALFALASNVPVLSAIQIIPGVPITLQVFLIAMMGLTLGTRGGLTTYFAVMILTACGLPLMAGGKGGLPVFYGPTCGYIYGWLFIVLLTGMYADLFMDKLIHKNLAGRREGKGSIGRRLLQMSLHLPVSFLVGMLGVLLDYLCGSAALAAVSGQSLRDMPALLLSNLAFLPGDMVKIGLASVLSLSLFAKPVFTRIIQMRKAV